MEYEVSHRSRNKNTGKHSRVWHYPPANLRVDICTPKFIDFGNQASPWHCFCQGRRGSCGSKCSRFATSLGLGTAKFRSHIGSIMARQSQHLALLELWKKLSSYQLCSIYFWRKKIEFYWSNKYLDLLSQDQYDHTLNFQSRIEELIIYRK